MNESDFNEPEDREAATPEDSDPDAAEQENVGFAALVLGEGEVDADDDPNRLLDPYATLNYAQAQDASSGADKAPTAEERLLQGHTQMAGGQIDDALNHYREAVRAADSLESSVANRVTLGDAYAYSGQALNAFRQYRRAIKTSPRKAEPHFSLAELYQRYGRLQSAIVEYRKAILYAPENAYYRYKLGDALALAGDLEGAVSELEETTHLKPQDGFYHFWLGDLYSRAERFEEAVREMQQATIFSPYDAYYNVRLGALYHRIGQTRDGAMAVRQAVKVAPQNGAYHCLLADFYSELNMDNRSMHHYQLAGPLDDYDAETLRRLRRHAGMEDDEMLALDLPLDLNEEN